MPDPEITTSTIQPESTRHHSAEIFDRLAPRYGLRGDRLVIWVQHQRVSHKPTSGPGMLNAAARSYIRWGDALLVSKALLNRILCTGADPLGTSFWNAALSNAPLPRHPDCFDFLEKRGYCLVQIGVPSQRSCACPPRLPIRLQSCC